MHYCPYCSATLQKKVDVCPECKKVIAEQAILSFDMFFEKIDDKKSVISFVKKHNNSSRKSLKLKANDFLNKWSKYN